VKRSEAKEKEGSVSTTADASGMTPDYEFEVFVGGLFSVARKLIKKTFAECGKIVNFDMPLTAAGESKGVAFIAYEKQKGMELSLKLHDTQLGKRWLTVQKNVKKKEKAPV